MKLYELNLLDIGSTIQMAGAIFQGNGKTFLCYFPDDKNDLPLEHLELSYTDWKHLVAQTDKLETEVLQRASDGTLAKVILRKSQRQIDQHVSWRVFKRDGYSCRYCGTDDAPLTVDHVVCWEEGGPSTEENLVASCRKCNKVRGNTAFADWLCHPRYLATSPQLSQAVRDQNAALAAVVHQIPRASSQRSR